MSEVIETEGDNVSSLLFKSFDSQNASEKIIIVQEGSPMPKLEIKTKDRVLQYDWHTRKIWLRGSESKKRLFVGRVAFSPCLSQSGTETCNCTMQHYCSWTLLRCLNPHYYFYLKKYSC